jgi:hypothetical protein
MSKRPFLPPTFEATERESLLRLMSEVRHQRIYAA